MNDHRAGAAVAGHPDGSLLDRIQAARAQRLNPLEGDAALPHVVDASSVLSGNPNLEDVAAGQVWLSDGPRRMLLWIRAVREGWVICHPATVNLDIADNSTLIAENFEPLGRPLGLMTSITGTVPHDRLATFVGVLDISADVNCLRDASQTGVPAEIDRPTGLPITGIADERLVLRQLVADDLAALDPIDDGDDDDDDDPEVALSPDS